MRSLAITAMVAALLGGSLTPAAAQGPETHLRRALNRTMARLNTRPDLRGKLAGFDRDSFDVHAFRGLPRASDTTIVGWFEGFSSYVDGTDSSACETLTGGEPTASTLASLPSTMDSVAIERWSRDWEAAVAASFLSPERPAVNDEEMMMAVFTLIAKLPDAQRSFNRKPSDKPVKMTPQSECRMMRQFFQEAMGMEEPTRMTLLRGLAGVISEKPKLPFSD